MEITSTLVLVVLIVIIAIPIAISFWKPHTEPYESETAPQGDTIPKDLDTGNHYGHPRPGNMENIFVVDSSGKIVPYLCGHDGLEHFTISVYGELADGAKNRPLCLTCSLWKLRATCILCAVCGKVIPPNSMICLYRLGSHHNIKEGAEIISGTHAVGCSRMSCGSAGAVAGLWTEKGLEEIPGLDTKSKEMSA